MDFLGKVFVVAALFALCVGTGFVYGGVVYLLGGKGLLVDVAAIYGTVMAACKMAGDFAKSREVE